MGNIKFRKKEIYRYLGYASRMQQKTGDAKTEEAFAELANIDPIVDEVAERLQKGVMPRHVTREFRIEIEGEQIVFYDEYGIEAMRVESKGLADNLKDCGKALLFAATLGDFSDRLVHRYEIASMAKAAIAQAAGAEFIEAYCDEIMQELKDKYMSKSEILYLKPRFSPGYGDFALSHQKDFFRLLELEKVLGLHLNDNLLMVPTKSVTAVIGLTENPELCHISKCARCTKTDCEFRMVQ